MKRLFSSSSHSTLRVVSSAFLRLLIFLPAIWFLACDSSSPAYHMTCFPGGSAGKESTCNVGDLGLILFWEYPLEEGMATHSSILAWRIPWIEDPGRLQSMSSQRVGHDERLSTAQLTLRVSRTSKVAINSLVRLLSQFQPVCCSIFCSNCCFLTCIQISQDAGQVVWHSHHFKNFPQFIVIHTVKGSGIVNKAEIDDFWNSLAF